jgi:hypothetical protein
MPNVAGTITLWVERESGYFSLYTGQEENQRNGGGVTGEDRKIDSASLDGRAQRQRVSAFEREIFGYDAQQGGFRFRAHACPPRIAFQHFAF